MSTQGLETLDTLSFASRSTYRTYEDSEASRLARQTEEPCDALALITVIATVYTNSDILEMQVRIGNGKPLGSGAVSQVTRVNAEFNRPSRLIHSRVRKTQKDVVIKRSGARLLSDLTNEESRSRNRSFITELRILGHGVIRRHENIVTVLGVNWNCFDPVSLRRPRLPRRSIAGNVANKYFRNTQSHSFFWRKPISIYRVSKKSERGPRSDCEGKTC